MILTITLDTIKRCNDMQSHFAARGWNFAIDRQPGLVKASACRGNQCEETEGDDEWAVLADLLCCVSVADEAFRRVAAIAAE
jgi:hypothetical protein